MSDLIRVNGTPYSWNSCSFTIDGAPYVGVTSMEFGQKRERSTVYGSRRDGTPLGKTTGKYSVPNVTMTMLRDSYDALTTQLTAKGLGSYGDAEFTIVVKIFEPGVNIPSVYVLSRCTIEEEKHGNTEGVEALTTDVTIHCLNVTLNGKQLASVIRKGL